MKIHHVVPHIHEEASGPSYSVTSLCSALAADGADVTLHVLEPKPNRGWPFPVNAYPDRPFLKRLGFSSAMRAGLESAAQDADVLHNHSLWMMPNVYPAWAVRGKRCKLVVAPRGTLEPWALRYSRWRKKFMWTAAQRGAVQRADCLHVTAESELQSVRAMGLRTPVAVIRNGVDVPELPANTNLGRQTRRLLYLGRIHPKKGLDNLIQAWARVQDRFSDWQLRIVGRDESDYLAALRQLATELCAKRIEFAGPAYGREKTAEYHRADLFVLPTHSENFGMVVAEALAHGTAVICTQGAPWPSLESHGCGRWIDIGVDPLAAALTEAMSQSSESLAAQGAAGRRWMQTDFSWSSISKQTNELYEWLHTGGITPDFVDIAN
jgi:glycosyltransferase involved in cell wall biosynthesis